jgi:hypothetical protein
MSSINYVNLIMTEINDLTDCIYESLIDDDTQELRSNIQNLIRVLRDVQKSHED